MDEFKSWTRVMVETRDDERQNYEMYIVLEDNVECLDEIYETIQNNRLRPVMNTDLYLDEDSGMLCEAIYLRITKDKAMIKKDDGMSIMEIAEKWSTVTFLDKPKTKGE